VWYTPVILVLGRLRKEDYKLKTNVGYRVRTCLKKGRGEIEGEGENKRGTEGRRGREYIQEFFKF
jgi:hypothetical protein